MAGDLCALPHQGPKETFVLPVTGRSSCVKNKTPCIAPSVAEHKQLRLLPGRTLLAFIKHAPQEKTFMTAHALPKPLAVGAPRTRTGGKQEEAIMTRRRPALRAAAGFKGSCERQWREGPSQQQGGK